MRSTNPVTSLVLKPVHLVYVSSHRVMTSTNLAHHWPLTLATKPHAPNPLPLDIPEPLIPLLSN